MTGTNLSHKESERFLPITLAYDDFPKSESASEKEMKTLSPAASQKARCLDFAGHGALMETVQCSIGHLHT